MPKKGAKGRPPAPVNEEKYSKAEVHEYLRQLRPRTLRLSVEQIRAAIVPIPTRQAEPAERCYMHTVPRLPKELGHVLSLEPEVQQQWVVPASPSTEKLHAKAPDGWMSMVVVQAPEDLEREFMQRFVPDNQPNAVLTVATQALAKREMVQRISIPAAGPSQPAASSAVATAALDEEQGLVFTFGDGEEGNQAFESWVAWVYHDGDGSAPSEALPSRPDKLIEDWSTANQRLAYHYSNYERVFQALQLPLKRYQQPFAGDDDARINFLKSMQKVAEEVRDTVRAQVQAINKDVTKFSGKSMDFRQSMTNLQKHIDQAVDYEHRAELQPLGSRVRGQHNALRQRAEIEKARSARSRYSAERTEKMRSYMGILSNTVAKEPTKARIKQIEAQVDELLVRLNHLIVVPTSGHQDVIEVLQHQALPSFFAFCSEDLIHQSKAMKRFLRQRDAIFDQIRTATECCPISAAVRTAARRHAEDLLRQHKADEERALAAEGERLERILMEQLDKEETARASAARARQERQERRLRKREEAALATALAEAEARAKLEAEQVEEAAAAEVARVAAQKEAAERVAAACTATAVEDLLSAAESSGTEVQLLASSTALLVCRSNDVSTRGSGDASTESRRSGQKKRSGRSRKTVAKAEKMAAVEVKVERTAAAAAGAEVGVEGVQEEMTTCTPTDEADLKTQSSSAVGERVGAESKISKALLGVAPVVLAAEMVVAAAPAAPSECGEVELELRAASAAWRTHSDSRPLCDAAAQLEQVLEARAEPTGDQGCGGAAGMMQAARWLSLMLECAAVEEAGANGAWPPAPGAGYGHIYDRFGFFVAEEGGAEQELSFVRHLTSADLCGDGTAFADLLLRTRSGVPAAAVQCPEVLMVSLGWSCEAPTLDEMRGALVAVPKLLHLGSTEYALEVVGCSASDGRCLALRRCHDSSTMEWESTPELAELSRVRGLLALFGGLVKRGFTPTLLAFCKAANQEM